MHRARARDAADIIAQQIDEHQVFRLLLRVARKFLRPREVSDRIGAPRTGASDGPRSDAPRGNLDEEFR